ncbi:hypothetical protein M4I21_11325 [Cellulophaga sp. 20_2_10]|uniref:hypothetical protein n=1 Tax=Cellulophaga sp. 20_2_10 TaxID=2942476 RepID=UPI00201AD2B5|nr:hypothetical protein [Cellulophaga sp. 20_2_10]MCL5246404.1 hypothetical protein [Cellulophaga sp. 20_2_10]
MKFNFKIVTYICLLALSTTIFSCKSNTEESSSEKSLVLPNGMRLTVLKTNKDETSIGILTGTNYGTTHTYKYNVLLHEPDVNWNFGSGEPKNILICKDTTYIHYINKNSYPITVTDSVTNTTTTENNYKIESMYQKHVDNRYFFNLFGDDFWLDVTPKRYNEIKNSCEEYAIPNDGELTIING